MIFRQMLKIARDKNAKIQVRDVCKDQVSLIINNPTD